MSVMMLFVLLGTMFLSLYFIQMSTSSHHAMHDCPFMAHEATFCPMDLHDHLVAWKTIFASALPFIVSVLLLCGLVCTISSVYKDISKQLLLYIYALVRHKHTYPPTYSYRFLQDLFSAGILNPKLF